MNNNQNNTNNNENNMGVQTPQVTPNNNVTETPVLENQNSMPVENVTASQVVDMDTSNDDDDDTPSGDASDITFDYNEIYGSTENKESEEKKDENDLPVFDEKEIVIDENKLKKDTDDIVPEFKINELEGNTTETDKNESLDKITDDKEADKADTRRKIAYILAIALILIIFVWFIFPIMAGYKM